MSDSEDPELCQCSKEVSPLSYSVYCIDCVDKYTDCFNCNNEIVNNDVHYSSDNMPYCFYCYCHAEKLQLYHTCEQIIENGMIVDRVSYCLKCYENVR